MFFNYYHVCKFDLREGSLRLFCKLAAGITRAVIALTIGIRAPWLGSLLGFADRGSVMFVKSQVQFRAETDGSGIAWI